MESESKCCISRVRRFQLSWPHSMPELTTPAWAIEELELCLDPLPMHTMDSVCRCRVVLEYKEKPLLPNRKVDRR